MCLIDWSFYKCGMIIIFASNVLQLCSAEANKNERNVQTAQNVWCEQLLKASDKYLSHVILEQDGKFV